MTQSQPTLEELRDEFRRNEMHGWLWPWLRQGLVDYIGRRIKGRYRPQVYSPTGNWDLEGCGDLANEFIVQRGIGKGAILRALLVATETQSLMAYLGRSLQRFVIAERPNSMSSNVFDRLRDALDQRPAFIRLGGVPPHSYYGLAEWEDDPPLAATDEILIDASRYLPNKIEWVTYGSGSRQSPGISSNDLERIAHDLLQGTSHLMTSKQMMSIIKRRFALESESGDGDFASLDDLVIANESNPLEDVEAESLAERALSTFTLRQRNIVRLMLEEPEAISTRELAAKLRISKSTAASELQAIQSRFRLLGASSEKMQRQILEALWPRLKAS